MKAVLFYNEFVNLNVFVVFLSILEYFAIINVHETDEYFRSHLHIKIL
jgi:hypothetical protein